MPRQSPRKARSAATATEASIAKVNGTHEAGSTATVSRRTTVAKAVDELEPSVSGKTRSARASRSATKVKIEKETSLAEESKGTNRKRKVAVKDETGDEEEEQQQKVDGTQVSRKRKRTAKQKIEDAMPLAKRTAVASLQKAMYIGAHVSSAGGVQNSVHNCVHIGANAFALFLKSQRKWANPPIAPEARDGFHKLSKDHSLEVHKHCLPHGSYLVNLAQSEKEKADQAYGAFLDDLERCESLGIKLYNFHPGNTQGDTKDNAIGRIAAQLNKSHKATSTVVTVLENMAGQGNVVGSTFEDLRDIIALVDDKSRVGVCIDTCHAFAAGYDLRSPETFADTMSNFNSVVGSQYLKAFHVNDSKAPLGSRRDLHANIGTGFLGLRAFHNLLNYDGAVGLPLVLETPIERKGPDGKTIEDKQVWADEIKLLESLIGMDPDGNEFRAHEERLQRQGTDERARIQDQVERKSAKDSKKGTRKRGKKKAAESSDNEDSGSD
ncbi:xylose isomerase-like protein [Xylariomycetidae sp. FL0641]|nr:xylose isomerase-like protein [Xylariomycetidae sp. FL0641]